jgi:hypothetical protein
MDDRKEKKKNKHNYCLSRNPHTNANFQVFNSLTILGCPSLNFSPPKFRLFSSMIGSSIAAPAPLSTSCPSLKRMCLDVLLRNPNVQVGQTLSSDIKELLLRRAVFGSCVLQQPAAPVNASTVLDVVTVLHSYADCSWLGFAIDFLSRFLGASRVRMCEQFIVKSVALLDGRVWENERREAKIEFENMSKGIVCGCEPFAAGHVMGVRLARAFFFFFIVVC